MIDTGPIAILSAIPQELARLSGNLDGRKDSRLAVVLSTPVGSTGWRWTSPRRG